MSSLGFLKLLNSSEYSDLKLYVGPDQEVFNVHRAIVCTRSPFFEAACKKNFQEGQTRQIKLPEIEPSVMRPVLQWIYEGTINYGEGLRIELVDIYAAADYLQLDTLKQNIQTFLEEDFVLDEESQIWETQDRFEIVQGLFNILPEENRNCLSKLGRRLVQGMCYNSLTSHFNDQSSQNFDAFIAKSYFNSMAWLVCSQCWMTDCKNFIRDNRPKDCIICRKVDTVPDYESELEEEEYLAP